MNSQGQRQVFSYKDRQGNIKECLVNSPTEVDRLLSIEVDIDNRDAEIERLQDEVKWLEISNVDGINNDNLLGAYNRLSTLYQAQQGSYERSIKALSR